MRMMDELKPLFLYSASKKVYAPVDEKDRRKNASILLLTPSMEISSRLMKLPYIQNPNLFVSYYMDRNIMAYIDNMPEEDLDFDEQEEEVVSEALQRAWSGKTKIKFNEDITLMNRKRIEEVANSKVIEFFSSSLQLKFIPENIFIEVYPTQSALENAAPTKLTKLYKDKLYSFSSGEYSHLLSYNVYNEKDTKLPYAIYVLAEILTNVFMQINPDLDYFVTRKVVYALIGSNKIITTKYKYSNTPIEFDDQFIRAIIRMLDTKGNRAIRKYIETADVGVFRDFILKSSLGGLRAMLFEGELSYMERQRLLPSEFGIPNKRKYPLNDEDHVRAAIRMFNNCDPDDEEELAENIIRKIKKFEIKDVKVSAANRFKKYYKKEEEKKEESITESFIPSDYADVLAVCNSLNKEEFSRISFYDTYRDSKFIIKRIIKYVGPKAAGFLDVYHFPSKPHLAQIVIAVHSDFRGQGIADSMVKEMLSYDLHKDHHFTTYYWTVHKDNPASKSLALKNGFMETNKEDKYGRDILILPVVLKNDMWRQIPDYMKPTPDYEEFAMTESSFVTSDMAFISEAEGDKYSQTLKKYLYKERIKNNRGTLQVYEQIKTLNPEIRRMYIKLDMYKRYNIFVDLSYYHALFLQKNVYKLDRAVNYYFDFLNRLLNNKEIDSQYKKKTIFIPVDADVWPTQPNTEVTDFRKNLNPISIIFRLIRTNPMALKKAWGGKDIIFVGTRGYFKVDFSTFELKNLSRFKTNLRKLMSADETVVDEFEKDTLTDDKDTDNYNFDKKNVDSSRAIAAKIVDDIEMNSDIKLDNMKKSDKSESSEKTPHLTLSKEPINIDASANDNIAIITVTPDGYNDFQKLSTTVLSGISADNYCIPK